MRNFKKNSVFFVLGILLFSCAVNPTDGVVKKGDTEKEQPVVIANDSLEYEVIIFDVGYNLYLNTIARPKGYYSQKYMENWNKIFVTNWNNRVLSPNQYDTAIYNNVIDYNFATNYGLDVNYKLFNYFLFAQRKYKMRLDNGVGAIPRVR